MKIGSLEEVIKTVKTRRADKMEMTCSLQDRSAKVEFLQTQIKKIYDEYCEGMYDPQSVSDAIEELQEKLEIEERDIAFISRYHTVPCSKKEKEEVLAMLDRQWVEACELYDQDKLSGEEMHRLQRKIEQEQQKIIHSLECEEAER